MRLEEAVYLMAESDFHHEAFNLPELICITLSLILIFEDLVTTAWPQNSEKMGIITNYEFENGREMRERGLGERKVFN